MSTFSFQRRVVDRRGRYRWLQVAVIVPAVVSVVVHAGAAIWVRAKSWTIDRPDRVAEAPFVETVLALEPPPAETPVPRVEPVPEPKPTPPPEPKPKPLPEVRPPEKTVRVEPAPAPAPAPVKTAEPTLPIKAPAPTPQPEAPPPPPVPRPATFAGVKADVAGRVVYVVDASGSMTSSLSFVLDELSRSIERLDESQAFQVILFREPPPDASGAAAVTGYEMFRPNAGLVPATRANKDAARGWARTIRPLGRSSPLPGLSAALSLDPDLVFLLSRSIQRTGTEQRTANQAVLSTLDDLNPANPFTRKRRVVIKTIQFIDDDPSGLLQAIAGEHGDGRGSYRLLSLEDLDGR